MSKKNNLAKKFLVHHFSHKKTVTLQKPTYTSMGKIIQFFNYDAALSFYEDRIEHMRQGSVTRYNGVHIIAKPILILSVIIGIKNGTFKKNRFDYESLNQIYEHLFRQYFYQGQQTNLTPLCYPFYYLQTDQFWHLSWKGSEQVKTSAPSVAWINRQVDYGFIDEELWLLLQNDLYADKLKEYIIKNKIIQSVVHISKAAEPNWRKGLKSFITMLMAI